MQSHILVFIVLILGIGICVNGFQPVSRRMSAPRTSGQAITRSSNLQMNFFTDAARFFSNMNKEASAKHILVKSSDATSKLKSLKEELEQSENLSTAFSELAAKVSECPSASRGGNLGTFKPGMMVKEFDKVVFEEEVGKVHGPIETQFGSHLILIT
jgi:peptidyl-prolyl cis-trans isomerase C